MLELDRSSFPEGFRPGYKPRTLSEEIKRDIADHKVMVDPVDHLVYHLPLNAQIFVEKYLPRLVSSKYYEAQKISPNPPRSSS